MPQGRDSFKTTLVQITRSTRETRLVWKTILDFETDQRHVLVAYRVIVSRRFLSSLYIYIYSLYTLASQKR